MTDQKATGKVSLDHNTYSPIVHRILGYWYCLLSWLLFTVYTITVDYYTVPLLSLYHPGILSNMDIDYLTELNNNVNEQLILELEKLIEETTFVF